MGSTLTATPGTWTDPAELSTQPTITYVWSDASSASLATTATYVPTVTDIGQVLTVTVTATNELSGESATAIARTPDGVTSTVVNLVAPQISGSLTVGSTLTVDTGKWTASTELTYSYTWAAASGDQSGVTLGDTTNTHVITTEDVGQRILAIVTATSTNGEYTYGRAMTERIVPPSPFATDAGLTSANAGTVTVTQPNKTTAVVTVPGGVAGTSVYVYAYSTPVGLGFYTLDANGAITVSLAGLAAGEHRLLVLDASGAVIGWVSVTVGSVLAATGGEVSVPLVVGGGALVLFGLLAVLYVARQRRSLRSQD